MGAEAYRSLNQLYYKKAAIVMLVYSASDYESFRELKSFWTDQVDQYGEEGCLKFLVAAKIDDNEVDEDEAVTK